MEIKRYMAIPGQALSYEIGQLKFLESRRKAKEALDTEFNIRAVHDEIDKDGIVTA